MAVTIRPLFDFFSFFETCHDHRPHAHRAIAYRGPPRRHAYIALFNYCFAKQHGGEFILRIEDTDQLRSTASRTADLRRPALAGHRLERRPGRRRPARPVPAERAWRDLRQYASTGRWAMPSLLLHRRRAGPDARRATGRGETPRYDGRALLLSKKRWPRWPLASRVIRMKVPSEGVCVVPDMLRGDVEIPWDRMDMQVLMKTDGLPTYFSPTWSTTT
jgi:glutamyl-tRNA synthetase